MAETVLQHLTKRNVGLQCCQRWTNPTVNDKWAPVENIAQWPDFNYQNLLQRYGSDLSRQIQPFNPVPYCEEGGFNRLFDESGLNDVICATIMLPVSYALPPNLFITSGGRTMADKDVFPDWGAGDERKSNKAGRSKALVIGDTKYGWPHRDAISIVQRNNDGYEYAENKDFVRPMEQGQHYGIVYNCRYVFIMHEEALVILRLRISPDPIRNSPRPKRNIRALPQHQRVISSSTISDVASSVSGMSIDSDILQRGVDIGLVEYTVIPWTGRDDGMTINLALYYLVRLADEGNGLGSDYDPLGPPLVASIQGSSQYQGHGRVPGKDDMENPEGKGKGKMAEGHTKEDGRTHSGRIRQGKVAVCAICSAKMPPP